MRHAVFIIIGMCLCSLLPAAEKARTWTNTQGRVMRAEFVREVDGEVSFIKDGKLVTLPLDLLCEADKKIVRNLQAGIMPAADEPAADEPSLPSPAESMRPASDAAGNFQPPSLIKRRPPPIANRVWTLADGQQTTAKFVRVFREQVILLRGSRTVMYSYDALSAADQDYVKDILTARGEEKLIPPPATVVMNDPAQPAEGEATPPASAVNDQTGELSAAAAPSTTFDELHKRQEEQRAQLAADLEAETAARNEAASANALANETATNESGSNEIGPDEKLGKPGPGQSAISAEKLAELRPVLIIGGVIGGVFGMVAVVIAAAIMIASASGRSRARRYS